VLLTLATLLLLALAGCGDVEHERPSNDRAQGRTIAEEGSCGAPQSFDGAVDDLTPREVLDRLASALTCPGHVAHLTARVDRAHEIGPGSARVEFWLDVANGVLRIHSGPDVRYAPVQIANDDGIFRRYRDDETAEKSDLSPLCSEYSDPLLPYLIDDECFFLGWGPTASIGAGEYSSEPAVVLRTQQLFPYGPDEEDGIVEYDTRVYVDPDTFVLRGMTNEGTLEGHALPNERFAEDFELDFVPLSSLAQDFFDPASIGYVQPVSELDELEGTPYWLGETLPESDGFAKLRFDDVWSPERAVDPGSYIGIVYYQPDVALHEYAVERFGKDEMRYWQEIDLILSECLAETVEIELEGAHAIIWGKAREENNDGTCGPATHYEARVFFEETMVTVITSENTGAEFDSLEGMEHVIRGLKPRE
jgi:hypothetical protein